MHDTIVEEVRSFEAKLAEDEELVAEIISSGQPLSVTSVRYRNPHLLIFSGLDVDGNEIEFLQHPSQVNLRLRRVKVSDRKPRHIGFDVVPPANGALASLGAER